VDEKKSLLEVARSFNAVGANTANRWLREAGIEVRPRGWNVNGFQSDEHRKAFVGNQSGENHWNWKGGVSSEGARYRASAEWARIRREVYERDGWLCQECGIRCLNTRDSKKHPKRKIQCHHVVPRRLGGPDHPDNLITLCMSCHHRIERGEAHKELIA